MATGSYLSIITLNVNGLNSPRKRQRLAEWIQKQDPYICCLQETHLEIRHTYRLKVKGWEKIFHANRDYIFIFKSSGHFLISYIDCHWWVLNVCVLSRFSLAQHFATLWTVAHQAPLSMGLSRQEYWSGLLWPPPGDLSNPRTEPLSLMSSISLGGFFASTATWEAQIICFTYFILCYLEIINKTKCAAIQMVSLNFNWIVRQVTTVGWTRVFLQIYLTAGCTFEGF